MKPKAAEADKEEEHKPKLLSEDTSVNETPNEKESDVFDLHRASAEAQSPCRDVKKSENEPEEKPCLLCEPCGKEDFIKSAHAFCIQCAEHMCISCTKTHGKFSQLRHHTVLEGEHMPLTKAVNKNKSTSEGACWFPIDHTDELCHRHAKEPITFYCPEHDVVGCGHCMVPVHGTCRIRKITDILNDFNEEEESRKLVKIIDNTENEFDQCLTKVETAFAECAQFREETIGHIQRLRAEVSVTLARKEDELCQEVETVSITQDALLDCLIEKCTKAKEDLRQLKECLKFSHDGWKSFLLTKQARLKIIELQEAAEETKMFLGTRKLSFSDEPLTTALLYAQRPLGQPRYHFNNDPEQTTLETSEISRNKVINLFSPDDDKTIWITGMASLSPDMIVVVDNYNKVMKVIDLSTMEFTLRYSTPSRPWAVTKLGGNEIAVTLPFQQKILIYKYKETSGRLKADRSISVKGECHGISFFKGKLAVSYVDPEKVEIMTHRGQILFKYEKDLKGSALFSRPLYLSFSNEGQHIYVSEYDNFAVIKLSPNAPFIATYEDQDLCHPTGITCTSTGRMLVCSHKNDGIQLLTEDLTTFQTLLSGCEGLQRPQTMCYLEDRKLLIVSCGSGRLIADNVLHVFNIQ